MDINNPIQSPSIPEKSRNWKKMVAIGFIILVVLAVCFIAIKFLSSKTKKKVLNPPASSVTVEDDGKTNMVIEIQANRFEEKDNDGDDLYDKDETEANTDINNPDTDGDGLSDGDEVRMFLTNPLNKDTDKDGFMDGEEILSLHNPKGAGAYSPPSLYVRLVTSSDNGSSRYKYIMYVAGKGVQ